MSDARGKGLKAWQKTLTEADRSRIGQAGGKGRAKALSAAERHRIAVMGGKANKARLRAIGTLKS